MSIARRVRQLEIATDYWAAWYDSVKPALGQRDSSAPCAASHAQAHLTRLLAGDPFDDPSWLHALLRPTEQIVHMSEAEAFGLAALSPWLFEAIRLVARLGEPAYRELGSFFGLLNQSGTAYNQHALFHPSFWELYTKFYPSASQYWYAVGNMPDQPFWSATRANGAWSETYGAVLDPATQAGSVPVVRFRFPGLTTSFGVSITGKWRLLGGTVQTGTVTVSIDTASTNPIHRLCPRLTPSALLLEVTGTTLPSSAPDGEIAIIGTLGADRYGTPTLTP
jgi:hypothetical protein